MELMLSWVFPVGWLNLTSPRLIYAAHDIIVGGPNLTSPRLIYAAHDMIVGGSNLNLRSLIYAAQRRIVGGPNLTWRRLIYAAHGRISLPGAKDFPPKLGDASASQRELSRCLYCSWYSFPIGWCNDMAL